MIEFRLLNYKRIVRIWGDLLVKYPKKSRKSESLRVSVFLLWNGSPLVLRIWFKINIMRLGWMKFNLRYFHTYCAFGMDEICQLILLFSLFLLLFMDLIAFFDTIYEFYCTISVNFYLYLQYFQQKIFNFNKLSRFQINPY